MKHLYIFGQYGGTGSQFGFKAYVVNYRNRLSSTVDVTIKYRYLVPSPCMPDFLRPRTFLPWNTGTAVGDLSKSLKYSTQSPGKSTETKDTLSRQYTMLPFAGLHERSSSVQSIVFREYD
jgi:hypothetical protein